MPDTPTRILPTRQTPDGWTVLTIHHSAVPGYDIKAASEGLTEEAIRQELEIDWSASSGKRVYTGFGREHHVAARPLEFDPRRTLYCGWDWGGTPAFIPTQLNVYGQWLIFPSLSPPEERTLGTYEFGELVAEMLQREYALPNRLDLRDLDILHFGDPAGAARPPRTLDAPRETRSCFDIIEDGLEIQLGFDERGEAIIERKPGWGWRVMPGAVNITDRLEAVRARLATNLQHGLPALVVDPRATVVIEGFLGGYHYRQRPDMRYDLDPEKNWYSHTMDALAYIATELFPTRSDNDDDEDEDSYRHEYASGARGRVRGGYR